MSDKEKLLIRVIIVLLSAVISYRIAFVDNELNMLDDRIDNIITNTGAV
jgi:hypothetical protein